MELGFLDKHFYMFVQPISSEYNIVGKRGIVAKPPWNVRSKPDYVILCSHWYTLDVGKI